MAETQQNLNAKLRLDASGWGAGIKSAEKKMERFGTNMFFIGSRISAAVTVPLGLLTKAVVKVGAGFDQAMTESLAIINDVSPKMRGQMEDTAKRIALTTKFSATEAAEAYFFLASSGMNAAETMQALPIVAKFAQAGVINLARATELLSDAYITLGLRTGGPLEQMRNMQRVADVLTEANNLAQGSITEFAEALTNKAAVAMRVFGIGVEEGVAALAAFAERGVKGKLAGQQLFIVIRDLQRAVLKNNDAWTKLVGPGAVFDEATGELRNLADIIGTLENKLEGMSDRQKKATLDMLGFQERSLQATLTLVGASERMRELEIAFHNAGGVVDRVAKKQMTSFTNQMHLVTERISQIGIQIFDTFRPAFEQVILPLVRQAITRLEEFVNWLGQTSIKTRALIIAAGGLVTVLGPLITAFGGLVLFITPLVTLFRPLLAVVGKLFNPLVQLGKGALSVKLGFLGTGGTLLKFAGWVGVAHTAISLLKLGFDLLFPPILRAEEQLHKYVTSLDITSKELNSLVTIYEDLRNETDLTQTETIHLKNAQEVLSGALGITAESFDTLYDSSNELQSIFREEIQTLHNLEQAHLREAQASIESSIAKIEGIKAVSRAFAAGGSVISEQQSFWMDLGDMIVAVWDFVTKSIKVGWLIIKTVFKFIGYAIEDLIGWFDELEQKIRGYSGIVSHLSDWFLNLKENIRGATQSFRDMSDKAGHILGDGGETSPTDAATGRQAELAKELAEAERELADAQSRLVAINERLKEGLEGTNEELVRGTKTGAAESIREIEDGFVGGEEASKSFQNQVEQMFNKIVGLGTNKLPILMKSFGKLTDEQKRNEGVLKRLWEAYKPIRKFMAPSAMPAEIENLTRAYREQEEHLKFLTTDAGKFVASMGNVDRKLFDIITQQDKVNEQWEAMEGNVPDSFFENHGDTIEDLAAQYGNLAEGGLRDLINAYFEWAIESHRTSLKAKGDIADAKKFIKEEAEDLNATLKSKAAEFHLFSLNTQDAEIVGLKKGFEERKLAHERLYLEMLQTAMTLTGEEQKNALESRDIAMKMGDDILEYEEKLGLIRLMKAREYGDRAIEEASRMSVEEMRVFVEKNEDMINRMRGFRDRMVVAMSISGFLEKMGGEFEKIGLLISDLSGPVEAFGTGVESWVAATNTVEHFTSALQIATSAYAAFNRIGEESGRGRRTAAGAVTGAQLGSAFGPWGAAVGAGLGAIAGFFMDDPGWEQIQNAIATRFQTSVSDELAKQIEETAEEIGSDWGAMLLHLNDIIEESGGITAENVDHWTAQVRDAFSLTEFGALDLAEAATVLNDNFGDLVEAGTLSSGVLKANVRELIELDAHFGTASEAIREFKEAMVDLAVEGLATFAEGSKSVTDTLLEQYDLDVEAAKESHDQKIKDQIAFVEALEISEEEKEFRIAVIRAQGERQWEYTNRRMLESFKNDFADKTIDQWDQLGAFTEMTFIAMMAGGASFLDALNAIDPSLEQLQRMTDITGIKGSEMIDQLLRIRTFKEENEGLILQIQGMNQLMLGLGNSANLSQGDFEIFGNAAVTQFDRLIEGGMSSNDALLIMAPSLQTLKDLQDEYGFKVDENTQRLIDMGVEQGVLGERARTTDEIMSEGMLAVAEGLGELIRLFGGDVPASIQHLSDVAREESGEINANIDGVKTNADQDFDAIRANAIADMESLANESGVKLDRVEGDFEDLKRFANKELGNINMPDLSRTYEIKFDIDDIPVPPGGGGGWGGTDWGTMGIPGAQHGGIISRPTLMVGGEGGEPEMIGPVSFMSEALRGALGSGQGNTEVVSELQSLREEIELLPIHIRDAIITSQ